MAQVEKIRLLDSDLQKCVLGGPLSRVTTYSLFVTGPYGVKEIDGIIRMLQLQREFIAEPDEVEPEKSEAA